MHRSLALALALSLGLPACSRHEEKPDLSGEVARLSGEVAALKDKLAAAEAALAAKQDQAALAATSAADAAKAQLAEKDEALAQKDAQLRTVQAELATLKKSEALAFAEIADVQKRGLPATALSRYEKFITDHPDSALTPHARAMLGQLRGEVARRSDQADPQRQEREVLQRFAENVVTLEEIAPLLRRKTSAEITRLLGPPSQSFRNGAEIGYAQKALNPATGERGMLIIRFESDRAVTLRVNYQGREMKL
jgi:hypothetical protein